jgi:hypothetical protein
MIKPISPDKVCLKKIPDEVIDVFNKLITKNFDGTESYIKQKEVVSEIKKQLKLKNTDIIFDNCWLDVEPLFREAGWIVVFDNPGFNETYEPSFTFKK